MTATPEDKSVAEEYDLVVLGSGEAGKYLAWTFARRGEKAIVIERRYVGGSCPNIACLPSKNLIHSAKVASYFSRAGEFGVEVDSWRVDMTAVRDRKRQMVDGLIDMHLDNFRKSGAELARGSGRFIGPKTLEITGEGGAKRVIHGKRIIINTGTRARLDDTPGLSASTPLTHVEALELSEVPGHLIVIGGGYIGLELSQAMRRLGGRVTVIDRNDRVLRAEDTDISAAVQDLFHDEGIEILTGTHITRIEGTSGQSVTIHGKRTGEAFALEGTHLLVATGRIPNTDGIGLELAGVEITERGHVKVNDRLETTAADIWAVGDCAGSPYFTHIGFDDFRVVRDNIDGGQRSTAGRQVPFCMFIDPEFARIGLSESEAQARGIPYRVAKIPMAAVLRTRTLSETRGFLKALVATDSDRILGLTAFGVGAGDIIAPVQVAMLADLPYTTLANAIFTHPTLPEGLVSLFAAIPPR